MAKKSRHQTIARTALLSALAMLLWACGGGGLPAGMCFLPQYDEYAETVIPFVVIEGHQFPYPVAPAPVLGGNDLYTEFTDCLVTLPNDWGYWAWEVRLEDGRVLLLSELGHLYALNAEGVPVYGAFSLR